MDIIVVARAVLAKTYPSERELREVTRTLILELAESRQAVLSLRADLGLARRPKSEACG